MSHFILCILFCLVNVYLEIDGDEKGFRQLKCEARQHELEQLLATQLCPIGR